MCRTPLKDRSLGIKSTKSSLYVSSKGKFFREVTHQERLGGDSGHDVLKRVESFEKTVPEGMGDSRGRKNPLVETFTSRRRLVPVG